MFTRHYDLTNVRLYNYIGLACPVVENIEILFEVTA